MSDRRFDKVFTDPRFMVAPKKVTKVKIDKRFEAMFSKKEFNVVAKVDKYGRRIDKKDTHALQNYYRDSSSGSASSSGPSDSENPETEAKPIKQATRQAAASDSDEVGRKYYDSDGKFHWSGESSSSSSSEDERAKKAKRKDKS